MKKTLIALSVLAAVPAVALAAPVVAPAMASLPSPPATSSPHAHHGAGNTQKAKKHAADKTIVPAIKQSTSATEWNKLVAAPPQSKMAWRTKHQAASALTAAFEAGKISSLPPIAGDDGAVLYPYGQSWPTVVCSPLHICVIQLAAGDKPAQVVLGEPGMWNMTQAMAGNTPLLALSPRFKGLHTNLMITATAKDGSARVYYINLVSDNTDYVPKIGFYFPGQIMQKWVDQEHRAGVQAQRAKARAAHAQEQTVAALPSLNADALDFGWKISCQSKSHSWFSSAPACGPIEPTRVFDDGIHTYIAMPADLANTVGLPTLMSTNTIGQPAIINYRFKDGYYIVDGVPASINLIAGNGTGSKQDIVHIKHVVAKE